MPRKAASKLTTQQPTDTLRHLTSSALLAEIAGGRMAPGVMDSHWPLELMALVHRDPHEIADMLGLPPCAARRVAAALELHRRLIRRAVPHRMRITGPEDVVTVMGPFSDQPIEHFYCLALDVRGDLIGEPCEISKGDVDSCDAGARAFFRAALRRSAVSAIAVHNHPSGDPTPSDADVAVTKKLIAAGKALDITLQDHVVVGPDLRFVSIRKNMPALWK